MRRLLTLAFYFCYLSMSAQALDKLVIKGDYSTRDSIQIVNSYIKADLAVKYMVHAMNSIWKNDDKSAKSIKEQRVDRWNEHEAFTTWLGKPNKISLARRKINKIHSRFDRTFVLRVTKENKGKCSGWISAWAVPFGKMNITLCEDFFMYRTHLQEKVLIHEVGHETGILSHRKIHGCRAAKRAAASARSNIAKRSTENYAWLAMSYLGLDCSF